MTPATEEEQTAAREAIEGALYRQELFYGLSGYSYYYYGCTGWTTMEEYCMEGKVESTGMTPSELVWMDLDGDGTEECVVRFLDAHQNQNMAVFHWQDGTVYAYYLDNRPNGLTADGVFYDSPYYLSDAYGQVFRFHQNQCYWECIPYPEDPVLAVWTPFPGPEPATP